MIGINLINPAILQSRQRIRHAHGWAVGIIVLAAVSSVPLGLELTHEQHLRDLRQRQQSLQTALTADRARLQKVAEETRSLESQINRSEALRTKRPWYSLLAMVSQSLTPEIWLTSAATEPAAPVRGDLDLIPKDADAPPKDGKSPQPPARAVTLEAPRALAFEGYALEHRFLYEFMTHLKTTDLFTDVTLIKANQEPVLGFAAIQFRLLCKW